MFHVLRITKIKGVYHFEFGFILNKVQLIVVIRGVEELQGFGVIKNSGDEFFLRESKVADLLSLVVGCVCVR